jgi:hypothetical protein
MLGLEPNSTNSSGVNWALGARARTGLLMRISNNIYLSFLSYVVVLISLPFGPPKKRSQGGGP